MKTTEILCLFVNITPANKVINQKAKTKREAVEILKQLQESGRINVEIYKFSTKCKFQFFVGNKWEWLDYLLHKKFEWLDSLHK